MIAQLLFFPKELQEKSPNFRSCAERCLAGDSRASVLAPWGCPDLAEPPTTGIVMKDGEDDRGWEG